MASTVNSTCYFFSLHLQTQTPSAPGDMGRQTDEHRPSSDAYWRPQRLPVGALSCWVSTLGGHRVPAAATVPGTSQTLSMSESVLTVAQHVISQISTWVAALHSPGGLGGGLPAAGGCCRCLRVCMPTEPTGPTVAAF